MAGEPPRLDSMKEAISSRGVRVRIDWWSGGKATTSRKNVRRAALGEDDYWSLCEPLAVWPENLRIRCDIVPGSRGRLADCSLNALNHQFVVELEQAGGKWLLRAVSGDYVN